MYPSYHTFVMEISDENIDECAETLAELYHAWHREERAIAEHYKCSDKCAGYIAYLRTRSRWSRSKEEQLVKMDKEGKQLPDVLAGEF